MILYFSGTGNSAYAAKRMGAALDDVVVNLLDKIRAGDHTPLHTERPWVVVAPTYAWRIPRIVQEWLLHTDLLGSSEIYFVLTCGGGIGDAGRYLEKLCRAKKLRFQGCAAVVMPENYIALYDAPSEGESLEIIAQAEPAIDGAARRIAQGAAFPRPAPTVRDRLQSGIVNDVFYPVVVGAKQFYATGACISCGKCAGVCPLDNIRLESGAPVWGKHCTHCMACICRCPSAAIEYGTHSKGRVRYRCPKDGPE